MDRNEILKTIGFSDDFLKALEDYDKKVPNFQPQDFFDDNISTFTTSEANSSHQIVTIYNNVDYTNFRL